MDYPKPQSHGSNTSKGTIEELDKSKSQVDQSIFYLTFNHSRNERNVDTTLSQQDASDKESSHH